MRRSRNNILYHATYVAYLPSILSKGLGGVTHRNWSVSTGDVCLTSDPENAIAYAEIVYEAEAGLSEEVFHSGIALLQVDVKGLRLYPDINIIHDEGEDPSIHFVVRGIIPPARLRLLRVIVGDTMWDTDSFN